MRNSALQFAEPAAPPPQGASCPPLGYKPIAEAIQRASSFAVWVGVPEYVADTPEPVQFGAKLEAVLKQMTAAGMQANRTVLFAHSLGGVMAQNWLDDASKADGLVLYGSTLLRSHRASPLPVPTLTLDGDLDGLLRVTRQAEAFHHQVAKATSTPPRDPVVLLRGLSHWSVSSGTPPSNVRKNDLKPEVAEADGHDQIARLVAAHLDARFGAADVQAAGAAAVAAAVANTSVAVQPLLDAMTLEGSKHLNPPCDSDYPTNPTCAYPQWPDKSLGPRKKPPSPLPPADCTCGSAWMATAAEMMAALADRPLPTPLVSALVSADAAHSVSDVRPFHLPHIFSPPPGHACNTSAHCAINLTTLTEPVYDSRDALDTGLYPIAATELRAKMKSRQAVWQAAGVSAADFQTLDRDNTSICRSINEASYAAALAAASPLARERFGRVGQPLVFGADEWAGIGITGPKWIRTALKMTPSADGRNVSVVAPTFATENKDLGDRPYTDTVGYHYCKLLSPARAIEWVYVDGLKHFGGLEAAAEVEAAPVEAAAACPDLPSLRQASVVGGFDAARLRGGWYENAYTDIAQVGAKCQRINNTVAVGDQKISQHFSTKYGPLPFAMTYTYAPVNGSAGVYSKYVEGAKVLLTLPTVMVDVGGAGELYDAAIEFTCKGVVGQPVVELRLLSREAVMPAATLAAMKATAVRAGIEQAVVDRLKVEDYSRC